MFVKFNYRWILPKSKKEIIDATRAEVIWAWDEFHARKRLRERINYQGRIGIKVYAKKSRI